MTLLAGVFSSPSPGIPWEGREGAELTNCLSLPQDCGTPCRISEIIKRREALQKRRKMGLATRSRGVDFPLVDTQHLLQFFDFAACEFCYSINRLE